MGDHNNEHKSASKPEIDGHVGGLTDQDLMAVTGGTVSLNFAHVQVHYTPQSADGPKG